MESDDMRQSAVEGVSHCDLVMKGGVTSGVIYPRLVAGLSDKYQFKNIGGTSAGAIAAGASAAAELGRQRGHAGAFERLARLPEELGAELPGARPGTGRSRLFTLFQPVPALRRHFDVLTRALGKPAGAAAISVLGGMVAMHGVAALAIAAVGAALLVPYLQLLASDGGAGPWQKLLAVVGLAVIVALVTAAMLGTVLVLFARSLLRGLKDNGYGLCSGQTQPGQGTRGEPGGSGVSGVAGAAGEQTALTDWLHGYFNELAGKSVDGPPLSFGDLWGPDPATRRINLEVITSAVSQQMVYSIPFRPGTPMFYYDPAEWSRLFPPAVMTALAAPFNGNHDGPVIESAQGRELRPLPRHGDLPVVVAIRMSLSFPLLLSAVPLYAVDWSRTANQRTQAAVRAAETAEERRRLRLRATRIWFSDGGIGSNMPLHLFDAMLPRHPTFAVNLKRPHPDHVIRPGGGQRRRTDLPARGRPRRTVAPLAGTGPRRRLGAAGAGCAREGAAGGAGRFPVEHRRHDAELARRDPVPDAGLPRPHRPDQPEAGRGRAQPGDARRDDRRARAGGRHGGGAPHRPLPSFGGRRRCGVGQPPSRAVDDLPRGDAAGDGRTGVGAGDAGKDWHWHGSRDRPRDGRGNVGGLAGAARHGHALPALLGAAGRSGAFPHRPGRARRGDAAQAVGSAAHPGRGLSQADPAGAADPSHLKIAHASAKHSTGQMRLNGRLISVYGTDDNIAPHRGSDLPSDRCRGERT
ncbi:hypothetical protein [Roseateles chitinivorans]|uniref:hypothetical protein n=1 Tax=Roseateles chitinivorans TaxID=2917965 RepID=UPI003D66CF7F